VTSGACTYLGSARVSRAGESVPLSRTFLDAQLLASAAMIKRLFRRDAETSTRDACAPQT
jgi:hypothetical protein